MGFPLAALQAAGETGLPLPMTPGLRGGESWWVWGSQKSWAARFTSSIPLCRAPPARTPFQWREASSPHTSTCGLEATAGPASGEERQPSPRSGAASPGRPPPGTWAPAGPEPSSCGWAVCWAPAKCRTSATAYGSWLGQPAHGTQPLWTPAAPTAMAEVERAIPTPGPARMLYLRPRAAPGPPVPPQPPQPPGPPAHPSHQNGAPRQLPPYPTRFCSERP